MHDIAFLLNDVSLQVYNIISAIDFSLKKFCSLTHEKRRECAEKRQTN